MKPSDIKVGSFYRNRKSPGTKYLGIGDHYKCTIYFRPKSKALIVIKSSKKRGCVPVGSIVAGPKTAYPGFWEGFEEI